MKRHTAIMILSSLLLFGCNIDNMTEPVPEGPVATVPEGTIPGLMNIKVSEDLSAKLLKYADANGNISEEGFKYVPAEGLNIKEVHTTFHIGGKFEKRQRSAGLHLWFTIIYDETVPVTRASEVVRSAPGIEYTEPVLRIKSTAVEMNDPLFPEQWHYNNTGIHEFTPGIDINLQKVWDEYGEFGNSSVIVAVIDQGIEYSHEDLASNMWVNEAELNGQEGVDDDGNGYVDDIYGYNFVSEDGVINPLHHGTHVAGTVAAVNNNGIGVSGVAGGRYPEPGARLMGLQIIDVNPTSTFPIYKVFQYAAENGAVIAQNSWSYDPSPNFMPQADKLAIDYFIDNAGMDENGNQTGPMKGGIAIFAAGNSFTDVSFPAGYERVLSVASIGPKGRHAWYTCFGDWVDICAPGGDTEDSIDYGGVLSTTVGNDYKYDNGTSMACPHVSGVAALLLSHYGGDGMTSDILFKAIVNSANPAVYDNPANEDMAGLLGSGMLDAYAAFQMFDTSEMNPVSTISSEADGNTITFKANLPTDDEGKEASYYFLYFSQEKFGTDNLDNATRIEYSVRDLEKDSEGKCIFSLTDLAYGTEYFYTVTAANALGRESAPCEIKSQTTDENGAPVITPETDEPFIIKKGLSASRRYEFSDPEGHKITTSFDNGGNIAAVFKKNSSTEGTLTVNGMGCEAGDYTCSITATDAYGQVTVLEINYSVQTNNEPVFAGSDEICIGSKGETVEIDLYDLFEDADGDELEFTFSIADKSIVSLQDNGKGNITLSALKTGSTRLLVTAKDPLGKLATGSMIVAVRDPQKDFDVYPNPASDFIKVRAAQTGEYQVTVINAAGNTIYSGKSEISIQSPLKIDLSGVPAGNYTMSVIGNGKNQKSTFVKL